MSHLFRVCFATIRSKFRVQIYIERFLDIIIHFNLGRHDVVKTLLRHSAEVNCRDAFEATPLHYAAQTGKCLLKKLLRANTLHIPHTKN